MGAINRFEDLPVWIIARNLTQQVYRLTTKGTFSKDFGLRDQIRRASISVMSNIAEGFEHESQAQFISYLGRAKASAGEIRCQLYIARDLDYLNKEEHKQLSVLAEDCSKQLFGFIQYLRTLPNSHRTGFTGEPI
jgi:four helix bundle protein